VEPDAGGAIEMAGEITPLEGLELTSAADEPAARPPARAAEAEDAGEGDLPLLDFDPGDAGDAAPGSFGEIALEPTAWQVGAGEEDAEGELPLLDVGMEFGSVPLDAAAAPDRPAPPRASRVDRVAELRERVRRAPEDAAARDELIAALHESGLGHEEPEILEEAHLSLAGSGRYRDAILPISDLIRLRPGDGPLLQKRVEYAFRSGDREALAGAYLSLARHFDAEGERNKAHAVYRRVLEMDPTNAEARAAMVGMAAQPPAAAPPPREAAPPPPAPAAPDAAAASRQALSEYIDLGELILEGERGDGTTRFVVEEKEPTGDEERDFADMLAHFRKKVAENIEIEDASSHYDLGLAFKEMGLLDEAIAEFQVALRGGANPLATLELLGQCFVEKGQYPVAARVLGRALSVQGATDAEMVGVLYQLARAQEAMGEARQAIEYYERVLSVDIRFRDTARRIEALRAGSGAA
jgi:tetratricopeptide (TPR) repeat protein